LAYNCPRAPTNIRGSGRLRAGFWPAAIALGVRSIYTPIENMGEGAAIDRTSDDKPSFTIINRVPYYQNLVRKDWVDAAKSYVMGKAVKDLEKYAKDTFERRELIDDITAE